MHEGEGERKMREFKEKILSGEEPAGRGEVAKTKVEILLQRYFSSVNLDFRRARSQG